MRKMLALLVLVGGSVACSANSPGNPAPNDEAVRGVPGEAVEEAGPSPNEEPGEEPGEGPSEQPDGGTGGKPDGGTGGKPDGGTDGKPDGGTDGKPDGGPTCTDPAPVTPAGWTVIDEAAYRLALPPGSDEIIDGPPTAESHRWWVADENGEVLNPDGSIKVGHVHAGVPFGGVSTLDEAEQRLRTGFFLDENGETMLTITRSSHDCREDLIATRIRPNQHLEWHHVVINGKVYSFGCDLRSQYADLCAKYIASFDVK